MDVSKKGIGRRFKYFRELLQLNIAELAEAVDTSPGTLSQIEAGDIFPPFEIPFIMYKRYGLNINWLHMGLEGIFLFNGPGTPSKTFQNIKTMEDGWVKNPRHHELCQLMEMPEVEKRIFDGLEKVKQRFKQAIDDYKEKQIKPKEIKK